MTDETLRTMTERDEDEGVMEYLDELRESGAVNMFGASEYVEAEFGVDRKEASRLVQKWMRTFSERHDQ